MLKSHFIKSLYLDSPFSFITISGSNKITEILCREILHLPKVGAPFKGFRRAAVDISM